MSYDLLEGSIYNVLGEGAWARAAAGVGGLKDLFIHIFSSFFPQSTPQWSNGLCLGLWCEWSRSAWGRGEGR